MTVFRWIPNTGRMKGYTYSINGSSMSTVLNWNPNGTLNQLQITDGFNSGGTQTCNYNPSTVSGTGYDDLGRLIGVDCGSGQWGQTFSFDPFGNVTQQQTSGRQGTTWNPGYNESNNHCTGCTYWTSGSNNNGDLTGDGNYVYGWNVYSKLAWAATSGTPSCGTSGKCITYDAFGRIVETSNGTAWTERWYTALGLTAYMYDTGESIYNAYFPAPGGLGTVLIGADDVAYNYLHNDWLGSVRVASNLTSHAITHDVAYSPFGNLYDGFDNSGSQYTAFASIGGNFYNAVTWDAPNRELSDFSGRWLSPDPAGLSAVDPTNPQSWNRYAYIMNNPESLTDPSGLNPLQPYCDLACAAQSGNNAMMGWGWDEFDLMNVPFVSDNAVFSDGACVSGCGVLLVNIRNTVPGPCTNYVLLDCGAITPNNPQQQRTQQQKQLCAQLKAQAQALSNETSSWSAMKIAFDWTMLGEGAVGAGGCIVGLVFGPEGCAAGAVAEWGNPAAQIAVGAGASFETGKSLGEIMTAADIAWQQYSAVCQ